MKCKECGSEMVKVYDYKEIEEQFKAKGIVNHSALQAQFNLLRNMTCPDCGFTKALSPIEITLEMIRRKIK